MQKQQIKGNEILIVGNSEDSFERIQKEILPYGQPGTVDFTGGEETPESSFPNKTNSEIVATKCNAKYQKHKTGLIITEEMHSSQEQESSDESSESSDDSSGSSNSDSDSGSTSESSDRNSMWRPNGDTSMISIEKKKVPEIERKETPGSQKVISSTHSPKLDFISKSNMDQVAKAPLLKDEGIGMNLISQVPLFDSDEGAGQVGTGESDDPFMFIGKKPLCNSDEEVAMGDSGNEFKFLGDKAMMVESVENINKPTVQSLVGSKSSAVKKIDPQTFQFNEMTPPVGSESEIIYRTSPSNGSGGGGYKYLGQRSMI